MSEEERKARIAKLGEDIAEHLFAIEKLFKVPVKVTLIIRNPSNPTGRADVHTGNDEWPLAKAAADRLIADPTADVAHI